MNVLQARLYTLMSRGTPFTADDVTADGKVTVAGDHEPNKKQNAIGAMIRSQSQAKRIAPTGKVVSSKAPHRKGGMIREWRATDFGARWAKSQLDAQR